ncbi:hypothetical protein Gorai_019495 [Gossypium raimondii]|uniref:RNase H type-1 domain-containing protein n=1 Tax=Gossypium raimondii TaxID=29730 RepID=A0A7J8PNY6_GOSRA|nr:hypothetical protein [Gossypium raimondii]
MEEVITFISGYGREYQDLSVNLKYPIPREMICRNPPPPSWVKVKVDAGFLATKQFSLEMGFMQVIMESNSKITIKNIAFQEEDYSETRLVTWDVRALERNFSNFRFEYNAHEGNSVAYVLVEEGMKRLEDRFWVEDAPMKAKELADSDHQF